MAVRANPSVSERLWSACSEQAAHALSCPFVSLLAAGTLRKASFQHYIAQDAFFLAAFSEAYTRAEGWLEEAGARQSLRELREAVGEELHMHGDYAKAWDIDLEDYAEPSDATKAYVEFLGWATSGANTHCQEAIGSPETDRDMLGETSAQPTGRQELETGSEPRVETDWIETDRTERTRGGEKDGDSNELQTEPEITRGGRKDGPGSGSGVRVENDGTETEPERTRGGGKDGEREQTSKAKVGRAIAAMVPCMRLYAYLGGELATKVRDLTGHPYREWIETYASPDFQASAVKLESVLESVCGPDTCLDTLLPVYKQAMSLELDFFDTQPGL